MEKEAQFYGLFSEYLRLALAITSVSEQQKDFTYFPMPKVSFYKTYLQRDLLTKQPINTVQLLLDRQQFFLKKTRKWDAMSFPQLKRI